MDCKEFSNLLDARTDGTLSDADERRMRAHAAECASCAARLTLREDLMDLDADAAVPDDFSAAWREQIAQEEKREEKGFFGSGWKRWAAAAAMLAVVLGGVLIGRNRLPSVASSTGNGAASRETAAEKRTAAPEEGEETALLSILSASGQTTLPDAQAAGPADSAAAPNAANSPAAFMEDALSGSLPDAIAANSDSAFLDEAACEDAAEEADSLWLQEETDGTAALFLVTSDLEAALEHLERMIQARGGRVEAADVSDASAVLTVRIPARLTEGLPAEAEETGIMREDRSGREAVFSGALPEEEVTLTISVRESSAAENESGKP